MSWLHAPTPATSLWSVSGIGGVGKTTLLLEIAQAARSASAVVIWIDGRTSGRVRDFLSTIDMALEYEYGIARNPDDAVLTHIVKTFSTHQTVLLIDNGENTDVIEGWLLSAFLPKLPETGVLLVMASRTGLPATWKTAPMLADCTQSVELDAFDDEELSEYLQRRALPGHGHLANEIRAKTQGLPLYVALIVDAMRGRTGIQSMPSLEDIPRRVSARVLREITSPVLFEALKVLAILPFARIGDLAMVMRTPFSLTHYRELARLSVVRTTPDGLTVHDVVRQILWQEFSLSDAETFREYCKTAMILMADRYRDADKPMQLHIVTHILELYFKLLPIRNAYIFSSGMPKQGEYQPFHPRDLPDLHRILQSARTLSTWQSEFVNPNDHHELLDQVAKVCPEGIPIGRSEEGVPLTMGVGLWLHAGTLPILERYAPRLLDEVLKDELPFLRQLPAEATDSFCVLLSAVDLGHPVYSPNQLGLLNFFEWHRMVALGARCIVGTGDPTLIQLLSSFGYQETMHLPDSSIPGGIKLLECDLRKERFLIWVKTMIQSLDGTMSSSQPALRAYILRDDETEVILKNLQRPYILEKTDFAHYYHLVGLELQVRVLSLLHAEIPPFPMTQMDQRILCATYGQQKVSRTVLGESLHLSRTTLYRHTRKACTALAQALVAECAKND